MRDMIDRHFEAVFENSLLIAVFIIGAVFLALFPANDDLADWIKGGAIIGVIARAFGTRNGSSEKKES